MFISLFSCTDTKVDEVVDDDAYSLVHIGDTLPKFCVVMSDGTTMNNQSLKNCVSVIVFFSTACPDCQHELPILNAVYKGFRAKGSFKLLAISRAEDASSIEKFWSDNQLVIPYSAQTDRIIYNQFATRTIPRIYVTNKSGVVISKFTDQQMPDSLLLAQTFTAALNM